MAHTRLIINFHHRNRQSHQNHLRDCHDIAGKHHVGMHRDQLRLLQGYQRH